MLSPVCRWWAAAKLLARSVDGELLRANTGWKVSCAVGAPAVPLEERVWSQSTEAVLSKVSCPTLLLPTSNDPDDYVWKGGSSLLL